MLKLLIVDGAEDFRMALADALRGRFTVKTCDDGEAAQELARSFAPDLLVLDLMIPGMDGLSLVQKISQIGCKPMVLATTRFQSEYVLDAAGRIGVDYMVVKPCNMQALVARLEDMADSRSRENRVRPDPSTVITNTLLSLGIATKNRGYAYLREAIPLYAADPQQTITKELYPAVGKLCDASPEQVERSMRTAIESAWQRREEQAWRLYFTPRADGTIPKPSNSEFISRLAELLLRGNGD